MGNAGDDPSIIIVESDLKVARRYADWLQKYNIRIAANEKTALEIIGEDTEIVLLNRPSEDISADKILENIQAQDLDCEIAMITSDDPDINIEELECGYFQMGIVTKDGLNKIIEKLLSYKSYDSKVREAFSLASKVGTLETEMDDGTLESSQEYCQAQSQLTSVFEKLDADMGEFNDTDVEALFCYSEKHTGMTESSWVPEEIVNALAERESVDPEELPALYDAVDPDALDTIFADPKKGGKRIGKVEFPYAGYTVTIKFGNEPTVTVD